MMGTTFAVAWNAMTSTPDITEFRKFVYPGEVRATGKIEFLFTPFFFQIFLLACFLGQWRFYPEKRTRTWFGAMLIFFTLSTLGSAINAGDALDAAARDSATQSRRSSL